jgi:hypothetical protein
MLEEIREYVGSNGMENALKTLVQITAGHFICIERHFWERMN